MGSTQLARKTKNPITQLIGSLKRNLLLSIGQLSQKCRNLSLRVKKWRIWNYRIFQGNSKKFSAGANKLISLVMSSETNA